MTGPTPDQLAPNIPPAIRDYVQAVDREQRRQAGLDLEDLLAHLNTNITEMKAMLGELNARMNVLERAIALTPSTRRRMELLVQVLKEQTDD